MTGGRVREFQRGAVRLHTTEAGKIALAEDRRALAELVREVLPDH